MDYERQCEQMQDAAKKHFKPEFLNRIDETIIFHSLSRDEMVPIVSIQLRRLARRLADKKLTVRFSKNAIQHLATAGYDPAFGARPLKRAIQKLVEDPLAMELLENRFAEGETVLVDTDQDGLVFVSTRESSEPLEAELIE